MKRYITEVILVAVTLLIFSTVRIPKRDPLNWQREIQWTPFQIFQSPWAFGGVTGIPGPLHAYVYAVGACGGTHNTPGATCANTTRLGPGTVINLGMILPTHPDSALGCFQQYEAWINNSFNAPTATVYFVEGAVNNSNSPTTGDTCRQMAPYLSVSHQSGPGSPLSPDAFNPGDQLVIPGGTSGYGHVSGFRMDVIAHTNGCTDADIQGPPYTMAVGPSTDISGFPMPEIVGALETPTPTQPSVDYTMTDTMSCVPLAKCATQSNADSGCGPLDPDYFFWQ